MEKVLDLAASLATPLALFWLVTMWVVLARVVLSFITTSERWERLSLTPVDVDNARHPRVRTGVQRVSVAVSAAKVPFEAVRPPLERTKRFLKAATDWLLRPAGRLVPTFGLFNIAPGMVVLFLQFVVIPNLWAEANAADPSGWWSLVSAAVAAVLVGYHVAHGRHVPEPARRPVFAGHDETLATQRWFALIVGWSLVCAAAAAIATLRDWDTGMDLAVAGRNVTVSWIQVAFFAAPIAIALWRRTKGSVMTTIGLGVLAVATILFPLAFGPAAV